MAWKSVWTAVCLICLRFGCVGTPAVQSEQQKPIVKIRSGLLEGIHFASDLNGAAFLGVPFAAPSGRRDVAGGRAGVAFNWVPLRGVP